MRFLIPQAPSGLDGRALRASSLLISNYHCPEQQLIGCLPSTQIRSSARTLFFSELVQHAQRGALSDSSSLLHNDCFATITMILTMPLCVLISGNAIGLNCAAEDTIRCAEVLGWSTHKLTILRDQTHKNDIFSKYS